MNRLPSVILFVLVYLSVAQSVNAQGATAKLLGEWKLDVEATKKELKKVSKEDKTQMFEIVQGITFTFQPLGKAKSEIEIRGAAVKGNPKSEGKWKTIDEKKNRVEIQMTFSGKKSKIEIEFLDKDLIRMRLLNKDESIPYMVMKRSEK